MEFRRFERILVANRGDIAAADGAIGELLVNVGQIADAKQVIIVLK